MAAQVKMRKFKTGVTVAFAGLPIEMQGDLFSVTKSGYDKEEAFKTVSPDDPPVLMKQMYVRDDGAGTPVLKGDCRMGRVENGQVIVVDPDAVKEAKASDLEQGRLDLVMFERDDVEAHLAPGKNNYVFVPASSNVLYNVLQAYLREHTSKVLVGKINMDQRSGECLYSLTIGPNGHLMFSQLCWPEDVNEFPAAQWSKPDAKVYDMSAQIIEMSETQFVPEDWKKESRDRLAQLIAFAKGGFTATAATPAPVKPKQDDQAALLAALEASLSVAKSKQS